jgi:hypothetical protein
MFEREVESPVQKKFREDSESRPHTLARPSSQAFRSFYTILLVLIAFFAVFSVHYGQYGATNLLPRLNAVMATNDCTYSQGGYCLSFDTPTDYWMCGWGVINVMFWGNSTETSYLGMTIDFVYFQWTNSPYPTSKDLWTDTVSADTGNIVADKIEPNSWQSVDFSQMPYLGVKVEEAIGTSSPTLLQMFDTQIEPQTCKNSYGSTTTTGTGSCVEWQANICIEWQTSNQAISTETLTVTITTRTFSTLVMTTTGYNTTQVSISQVTSYLTQVLHSYGTITATQYIYLESSSCNNTAGSYPTNGGSFMPDFGWLTGYMHGYFPSPLYVMAVAGGSLAALASLLFLRRRRGGGETDEEAVGPTEIDDQVLDYVRAHNGAVSVSKASEELGVSSEELSDALMRLKAGGKLQGG